MKALVLALTCSAIALVAGCGGESASFPGGGSPTDGGVDSSAGGTSGAGGSTGGSAGSTGGAAGSTGGTGGSAGSTGGTGGSAGSTGGTGGSAGSTGGTGGSAGSTGGAGGSAGSTGGTGGSAGTGPGPHVGTDFWAVDLPNERGSFSNEANLKPWGLVLHNVGSADASVTIQQNDAPPGQPVQLVTTTTVTIPVGDFETVVMPTREVTGWNNSTVDPPGPPMTWLSAHAFHVTSDQPLVAVQINTLENLFTSDASLLIPSSDIGTEYYAIGFPTANPNDPPMPLSGVPDRSSITIVGVQSNTSVQVTLGGNIIGGGGIASASAGDTFTVTLGPFDVLNLASDGDPGDLTGTRITASQPVAVFTSSERAQFPMEMTPLAPTPPGWTGDTCCTEHIEEQLFPVGAIGRSYVVQRSAIRSSGGYVEPDQVRFMAGASPAQVVTNLPAPFDAFSLQPGESRDVWATTSFIADATAPVAVAQALVSQTYTNTLKGDPSMTLVPPLDHHRTRVGFVIPTGWADNYFVIATPEGNAFQLDGAPIPAGCVASDAGSLQGVDYQSVQCPVDEGGHTLTGTLPFSVTVYGYGAASSYACPGSGY